MQIKVHMMIFSNAVNVRLSSRASSLQNEVRISKLSLEPFVLIANRMKLKT